MADKPAIVDSHPVHFSVLGKMIAARLIFSDDVDHTEFTPHSECLAGTELSRTRRMGWSTSAGRIRGVRVAVPGTLGIVRATSEVTSPRRQ
jgi:hypothetical protein